MPFSVGDAFITLRPTLASGFENAVANAVGGAINVAGLDDRMEQLGRKLTFSLTAGIAAGTVANQAQFQALEASIAETLTLFSAVGDRADRIFEGFQSGIQDVSDEVGQFEQTIADGLYQAISAGVPRDNVFDFLDVAGEAAVGGALEIESAVSGLTTAVNAFYGGDFQRAQEASDIFFRTVARGKTTFDELQASISAAAPLAQAAGVSFAEFNAVLATMTLSGTPTSEAVTNVRAALTGLLRPSEEMTAIFKDAGFATQSLATEQLGMQGALELVTSAVDREVGALIRLLGGAEAANAALQITGENAETFTSVFDDVSNATGAANAAFRTMDDTARGSFRRLGIEADQLGNVFGDIGSVVIRPIIDGFTNVISVGTGLANVLNSMPNSVKAATGAMVGLAAALGPVLVVVSKLVPLLTLRLGTALVSSVGPMRALGTTAQVALGTFSRFAGQIIGFIPGMQRFSSVLVNLGSKGMAPLSQAAGSMAVKFGGLIAAITAGFIAFEKLNDWMREIESNAKFATDQTEVLADSLGLLVKPAEQIDAIADEPVQFRVEFIEENRALLDSLREAQEGGFLEDRLVQVTYQLLAQGNSVEDVQEAIRQLAEFGLIDIPISFSVDEVNYQDVVAAIREESERTAEEAAAAFNGWFNDPRRTADALGQVEQLGEQAALVLQQEGPAEALDFLNELNDTVTAGIDSTVDRTIVEQELTRAFLERVDANEELLGRGFFSSSPDLDALEEALQGEIRAAEAAQEANSEAEQARRELQRLSIPDPLGGIPDPAEVESRIRELTSAALRESAAYQREQEAITSRMFERLDSTIETVTGNINAEFESIQQGLLDTMPLFGDFEAAVVRAGSAGEEDDFIGSQDIIDDLDAFNDAIVSWQRINEELVGEIPEELRNQLNQLPIEQRAGLAQLAEESPREFDKVIAAYEESFNLQKEVAEDAFQVELPGLIEEGNRLILEEAESIESEFTDIGANAASNWATGFTSRRSEWLDAIGELYGDIPGLGNLPAPTPPTNPPQGQTGLPRNLSTENIPVAQYRPQIAAPAATVPVAAETNVRNEYHFGDIHVTEQVEDAEQLSDQLFRQIERRLARRNRETTFVD